MWAGGVGLQNGEGRGASKVLPLQERGGADKDLAMLKGVAQKYFEFSYS